VSQLSVNTITNAAGGNTAQINGMTPTADSLQGFRNRIINGNMVISQRNAGASVGTGSGAGVYTVDRWQLTYDQVNKFTAQQNAGSVTPPSGYTNYLGITSSSAYTVGSAEQFVVRQYVEGFNAADLGWGTASAQSVTLSFWVRSSLTGTFGGALSGYANTNSYPFTFTISAANTWEQKTITVPGATAGTWNTGNSGGIGVIFGLGVGSTLSGTAGAWSASRFWSATGAVSVVGTSGATFYITGVQLEAGSVATPFERRPFGTELQLAMRYFEKSYPLGTAPGATTDLGVRYSSTTQSAPAGTGFMIDSCPFIVQKRATPTVVYYDQVGNAGKVSVGQLGVSGANNQNTLGANSTSETTIGVLRDAGGTAANLMIWHFTASAEL